MSIMINIFGDVCMYFDSCDCCDCLDKDYDEDYTEQETAGDDAEQPVSPEEVGTVIKTVLEALFPNARVEMEDLGAHDERV